MQNRQIRGASQRVPNVGKHREIEHIRTACKRHHLPRGERSFVPKRATDVMKV
jgi:hypothetical protein